MVPLVRTIFCWKRMALIKGITCLEYDLQFRWNGPKQFPEAHGTSPQPPMTSFRRLLVPFLLAVCSHCIFSGGFGFCQSSPFSMCSLEEWDVPGGQVWEAHRCCTKMKKWSSVLHPALALPPFPPHSSFSFLFPGCREFVRRSSKVLISGSAFRETQTKR